MGEGGWGLGGGARRRGGGEGAGTGGGCGRPALGPASARPAPPLDLGAAKRALPIERVPASRRRAPGWLRVRQPAAPPALLGKAAAAGCAHEVNVPDAPSRLRGPENLGWALAAGKLPGCAALATLAERGGHRGQDVGPESGLEGSEMQAPGLERGQDEQVAALEHAGDSGRAVGGKADGSLPGSLTSPVSASPHGFPTPATGRDAPWRSVFYNTLKTPYS